MRDAINEFIDETIQERMRIAVLADVGEMT